MGTKQGLCKQKHTHSRCKYRPKKFAGSEKGKEKFEEREKLDDERAKRKENQVLTVLLFRNANGTEAKAMISRTITTSLITTTTITSVCPMP